MADETHEGNTAPPTAAEALAEARRHATTDEEAGLIAGVLLAYQRWPAAAAIVAQDEGAKVRAAKRTFRTLTSALARDGAEILKEAGVTAFEDGEGPAIWGGAMFKPDWNRLKTTPRASTGEF